eukprot:Platyproteum_vivax@DN7031_c0_g1_i1.p1
MDDSMEIEDPLTSANHTPFKSETKFLDSEKSEDTSLENTELEILKNDVKKQPTDFEKWMKLLKLTEQGGDAAEIRHAYHQFLLEFPLCFGYWKRLAVLEKREEKIADAMNAFRQGVEAVACVDLWSDYCAFCMQVAGDNDAQLIRKVFEDGVAAIGWDWKASTFWDKYLQFEKSCKETETVTRRVSALFKRLFEIPLEKLTDYRTKFRAFVNENKEPVANMLTPDETVAFLEFEKKRRKMEEDKRVEVEEKQRKLECTRMRKEEELIKGYMQGMKEAQEHRPPSPFRPVDNDASSPEEGEDVEDGELPEEKSLAEIEAEAELEWAKEAKTAKGIREKMEEERRRKEDRKREDERRTDEERKKEEKRRREEEAKKAAAALKAQKDWLISSREKEYHKSLREGERRRQFEGKIRRSYFHNKPLEATQLQNWRNYLKFELNEMDQAIQSLETGDDIVAIDEDDGCMDHDTRLRLEEAVKKSRKRVVHLFERCLIVCNNYSEMWLKYVDYLQKYESVHAVRALYNRACNVYLRRRPDMHMHLAYFEEKQGDAEAAREVLSKLITTAAPDLLEGIVQLANLEKRCKRLDIAEKVYRDALIRLPPTNPKGKCFISLQLANFYLTTRQDASAAREVLYLAWRDSGPVKPLLLQSLLQFETHHLNCEELEEKGVELFEELLTYLKESGNPDDLTAAAKVWQQYIQFTSDYSSDIAAICLVQDRARDFWRSNPNAVTSKKRRTVVTAAPPPKQAKTSQHAAAAPTPASSASTADPNAAYYQQYAAYMAQMQSDPSQMGGQMGGQQMGMQMDPSLYYQYYYQTPYATPTA